MSGLVSVKCVIRKDLFDEYDYALRQSISDGLYNVVTLARDQVRPLTPYDPKHDNGGPHLQDPSITRYQNGTVSLQWRANRDGFYYGGVQNDNYTFAHPHGGGPGFMEAAEYIISQSAPDVIAAQLSSRGW